MPAGTQVIITKITPITKYGQLTYEEDYFDQAIIDDNGWLNMNFVPEQDKRYRLIVDSINKNPLDQYPRTTVTIGETGKMYRLITSVIHFVKGATGYIAEYPNNPEETKGQIVLREKSVGVTLQGYLTTLSVDPENIWTGGIVYYHNKPQAMNILRILNKAHNFLATYDPESKVISCGYSKDKDLTLTGATYYGYNASYTKKRLFVNAANKDEWNRDAVLQAFGNMLSNRYFRLDQNYFPQWGYYSGSKQALVNGWSQYFNSMSADSKKIIVNGSERDLDSIMAKGVSNEQAIVGALSEIERFDLIWPKIMENFSAGKSILNINDLYEDIKGQNFSPADVGQIFIKYGLKPKLISVSNTNTTKPMFIWSKNDSLGTVDSWEIVVSSDESFNNIIYNQSGINAETLDMSAAGGSMSAGLADGQYYWRVRAQNSEIDNFYSLSGQFNINLSFINIASAGGSVPIGGGGGGGTTPVRGKTAGSRQLAAGSKSAVNQRLATSDQLTGTFEIPAGAVSGEVRINVTPMTTAEQLGDFKVLGQKLYEIYPDEYAFQKACTIKFNLSAFTTEVNGCGIYRYNFQTKDWDFVGADYDSATKIMSASTSQLGIYGV